jgi:hypothetical protein
VSHKLATARHRILEGLVCHQRRPRPTAQLPESELNAALRSLANDNLIEQRTPKSWRATVTGIRHFQATSKGKS